VLPEPLGRWCGFKVVTTNEDNSVRCEAYLDADGLFGDNGEKPT